MWFRGETDIGCCRVETAVVRKKGERMKGAHGNAQGKHFPLPLAWKMRGAEFHEILQPEGLKPEV